MSSRPSFIHSVTYLLGERGIVLFSKVFCFIFITDFFSLQCPTGPPLGKAGLLSSGFPSQEVLAVPQRSHSCSQGPSVAPCYVRPGAGASCSSTEASDLPQALHFRAARTERSGLVLLLLLLPGGAPSSHATVTLSPSCNMHLRGTYLSPFPDHGLGFSAFSKHPDLSASLFPLPECRRVLLRGRGPEDRRHPPGRACLPAHLNQARSEDTGRTIFISGLGMGKLQWS